MCLVCRWPVSASTAPALALRDLLIPLLWIQALGGRGFVWKGQVLEASVEADRKKARSRALVRRFVPARNGGHLEVSLSARSTHTVLAKALRSRQQTRSRVISVMRKIGRADKHY